MVSSQTVTFLSWSKLDKHTYTYEESSKQVVVCNVSSIRVILLQWNTELQLQLGRAAPDPLACLLLILFMAGSNKIFRNECADVPIIILLCATNIQFQLLHAASCIAFSNSLLHLGTSALSRPVQGSSISRGPAN